MDINAVQRVAVTHTWQITLLIAVIWGIFRFAGRRNPHLEYVFWMVVIIKCLLPPLWSLPSGVFCWWDLRDVTAQVPQPRPWSDARPFHDPPFGHAPPQDAFQVASAARRGPTDDAARAGVVVTDKSSAHILPLFGWLLGIWAAGALSSVAMFFVRWVRCWKVIRRHEVPAAPFIVEQFHHLAQKLHVRRPVRLLISSSSIGPAAMGLLRPVVVLPEALVRDTDPRHLGLIIAHELIHIRRGDLWLGLGQTVARSVWWFHPLVALASRAMTRAVETCCDQQVVGQLRCEPADYARSLLEVLQCRSSLAAVPDFPGVKQIAVTHERMERIMKSGTTTRTRSPRWCWLVFFVLAAATLPGATLVRSVEGSDPNTTAAEPAPDRILPQEVEKQGVQNENARPGATTPRYVTRVYDVHDLIVLRRSFEHVLMKWNRKSRQWEFTAADERLERTDLGYLVPAGFKPTFASLIEHLKTHIAPGSWDNEFNGIEDFPTTYSLVISQTEEVQAGVAEELARLRSALHQTRYDLHILQLPLGIQKQFALDTLARRASEDDASARISVQLDETHTKALKSAANDHPLADIISKPTVILASEQPHLLSISYNMGTQLYNASFRATRNNNGEVTVAVWQTLNAADSDAVSEVLAPGDSLLFAVPGATADWAEAEADHSLLGRVRNLVVGSGAPEALYLLVTPRAE